MDTFNFHSNDEEETIQLGRDLAKLLEPEDVVCLFGPLGSGKTTLVKGIAQGLKINPKRVVSPTFVLMNSYESKVPLYHFDLYRLNQPDELVEIGYEEFIYGDGIAVVEWAERFGELMPEDYLDVHIAHKDEQKREFQLIAKGKRYQEILKGLKKR